MKRGETEDLERTRNLLRSARVRWTHLEHFPGGSSARFVKVSHKGQPIALAKLNDVHKARITHEEKALRFLKNSSEVPVPSLLASTSNALLLEWIEGERATPQCPDSFWRNFGAVLARLHSLPTRSASLKYSSDPLELGQRLLDSLERQVRRVENSELRNLADSALTILRRHHKTLENPHRFIHRDLRRDNILVGEDSEVAALLDFESAASADPAWDFVKLRWWVLPTLSDSAFLDGYEAVRPAPENERIRLFILHESASLLSYFEHRNDTYVRLAAASIRHLI